ncbi:unnamed protein product [Sphenostylis stenocarpa]|uniref:Uncharacterized protein n=1 Tax=Sphenostylis stenocarpa TaxID=92480 RepID=A0AA86S9U5_9FABA|nr:unnamed protein product [Sphenostylis stenocarpa]
MKRKADNNAIHSGASKFTTTNTTRYSLQTAVIIKLKGKKMENLVVEGLEKRRKCEKEVSTCKTQPVFGAPSLNSNHINHGSHKSIDKKNKKRTLGKFVEPYAQTKLWSPYECDMNTSISHTCRLNHSANFLYTVHKYAKTHTKVDNQENSQMATRTRTTDAQGFHFELLAGTPITDRLAVMKRREGEESLKRNEYSREKLHMLPGD